MKKSYDLFGLPISFIKSHRYKFHQTVLRFTLILTGQIIYQSCNRPPVPSTPVQGAEKLTITSISPTHGFENTIDTISGSGFSPIANNNTVFFNYISANVVSATSDRLIVIVPASTTGNVDVGVNGVYKTGPVFTYDNNSTDSVIVSTLAGSGIQGSEDGIGTSASFSFSIMLIYCMFSIQKGQ
jgi:hypothetical protein